MANLIDVEKSSDGFYNVRSVLGDFGYRNVGSAFGISVPNSMEVPPGGTKLNIEFDIDSDYRNNLNFLKSFGHMSGQNTVERWLSFTQSEISDNLYSATYIPRSMPLSIFHGLPFNVRVKVWFGESEVTTHHNFLKVPDDFYTRSTSYVHVFMTISPNTEILRARGRYNLLDMIYPNKVYVASGIQYNYFPIVTDGDYFQFLIRNPNMSDNIGQYPRFSLDDDYIESPIDVAITGHRNLNGSVGTSKLYIRRNGVEYFNNWSGSDGFLGSIHDLNTRVSLFSEYAGEIKRLKVCYNESLDIDKIRSVFDTLGDNIFGEPVAFIRDYETGRLHALVSPDRAVKQKDYRLKEYEITNEKAYPMLSTIPTNDLTNLKYGQIGYGENGKFELLNIHKDNWEYTYRNILQRKDRKKEPIVPVYMHYMTRNKGILMINGKPMTFVNFMGGSAFDPPTFGEGIEDQLYLLI